MDLVSLGFLLLMVVVGGVVAYLADNWGRTLGKKRLTIFGLRPRHTATLLTVLAGMFIPLLTVLAVSAASSDVRQWIAEGRLAIGQRDEALRQKKSAEDAVKGLQEDQKRLMGTNNDLRRTIQQGRTALSKVREQVAALKNQIGGLQNNLASIRAQFNTARTRLASTQQQLALVEGQHKEAERKLAGLQKDYTGLNATFEELNNQKRELEKRNVQLDSENARLDEETGRLKGERDALQSQIETNKRDLADNQQQLEQERMNLDAAKGEIQTAKNQLESLWAGVNALRELRDNSRTEPLMFAMDQEVARISVPQGVDAVAARAYLQALLKKASDVATKQGAAPLRGGPDPAGLVERQDDKHNIIGVEEQERKLGESIQKEKSELVLVARSLVNSFKGEFVGLDVRIYRNPLIYRSGQVISEGRIFAHESEVSIYNQVVQFLQGPLKDKAIKDGMIPIAGAQQSLGEVGSDEMLQLMRNIKSYGRPVRLFAMAGSDTRAGDPLKLEFRLR